MRILVIHTRYLQPGGEDQVFTAEVALLRGKGHKIAPFTFHNQELEGMPRWRQAVVPLWNPGASRQVQEAIRAHKPHLVHVHNTFPLASPAVIRAAKAEGVPVVMTLHNYRLLCVNALFFREDRVCEDCLGHLPWRGVMHGCYRNSRAASAVVAGMTGVHRAMGTWGLVDRFIALTEFARGKFLEAGFPAEKVVVKPNFVNPDPGPGEGEGGYALFVGRLSPEKGVGTLLRAWESLGGRIPLKIAGDGPMARVVGDAAERMKEVEWLGQQPVDAVRQLMSNAAFLVFPSEWYEGFPMVLGEALATGLPVLVAGLGSQSTIISDGRTGLHFRPGDPEDLAAKVEWLLSHPQELARMRREARAEFEAKYTAERNYRMLMEIYEGVLASRKRG